MNDTLVLVALSGKEERLLDIVHSITDDLMQRFRKNICIKQISSAFAGEYFRNSETESSAVLAAGCTAGSESIVFGADAFVKEIIIGEKSVITPFCTETLVGEENKTVRKTIVTDEVIAKAAEFAFLQAEKKHTELCVCACAENLADESFFMKNINELAALHRKCNVKIHDLWNFSDEYDGESRIIFADEKSAVCVINMLRMKRKINDVYACVHTERAKLYATADFCCEKNPNSAVVRSLNTVAAILENEYKLKNEAHWLRRAVYTAVQTCFDDSLNVFVSEIKKTMKDRMRKLKTEG